MELLSWIPHHKLSSTQLNINPNALDYIIKYNIPQFPLLLATNPSKRLIYYIITNKVTPYFKLAIPLKQGTLFGDLITCSSGINYESGILINPDYISFIEENFSLLNKSMRDVLYANPAALHLISLNPKHIAWDYLSQNTNPIAIKILKKNIREIYWTYLSANPSAIEILTENQDKIVQETLKNKLMQDNKQKKLDEMK